MDWLHQNSNAGLIAFSMFRIEGVFVSTVNIHTADKKIPPLLSIHAHNI